MNPTVSVTTKSGRVPSALFALVPRPAAWSSCWSRRGGPWSTCQRRSGHLVLSSYRRWCSQRARPWRPLVLEPRTPHGPGAFSSPSLRFMVSIRRRMARLSYSSCCSLIPGEYAAATEAAQLGVPALTLGNLYSRSASSTSSRLAASLACASKMRMINSVLSTPSSRQPSRAP